MHFEKIIGDIVFKSLRYTRLHTVFSPFYSGIGTVLRFHRVLAKDRPSCLDSMKSSEINVKFFIRLLDHLQESDYNIIAIDDMYEILIKNIIPEKKFVVLTFDDGFADTYDVAYPILKKRHLPFTVYICTNFPDENLTTWWYKLESIILKQDSVSFTFKGNNYQFETGSMLRKNTAFESIRSLILREINENLTDIQNAFATYKTDQDGELNDIVMKWNEIVEMNRDPLVTIGAHTVRHLPLKTLGDEAGRREIMLSKEIIESKIFKKVDHFAYPYGKKDTTGAREFAIASECGFKTMTTTRDASIFREHAGYLNALPRIGISGRRQDLASFKIIMDGAYSALSNKFHRIVTI
jgi:peptidoglycan/xylan/chitin deacetylase (PgdA/CDA1 family)